MDRIYNPDRLDDDRRFSDGDFERSIDATPLAATFLNDVQEEVCAVIEGAGMTLEPGNQAQLLAAIKELTKAAGQSTQVQIITQSSTFKKPPGAKSIHILMIGGGQGGGSGSTCPPDGSALGGAGGTGGARLELTLDAALFPDSCAVVVGIGGLGGAASAVAGSPGGNATETVLSCATWQYRVSGGNTGNNTAVFSGGVGGVPSKLYGGRGGSGGSGSGGAPGGGAGASISDGHAGAGGSSAFSLLNNSTSTVPGGSGGSPPGGAGLNVPTSSYAIFKYPGVSGGGGGARYNLSGGNGGRGGDGGLYGAGGGGGGATLEGGLSGAGGRGADGVVVITTYF